MKKKILSLLVAVHCASALVAMQPCAMIPCMNMCPTENECPHHVNAFVNVLAWRPREDGLDYVIKNANGATFLNNASVERVNFDWNGGFRVGLGYCNDNCAIGMSTYYTRFTSDGCDSLVTTFPTTLFPVWSNPSTTVVTEQEAQARVKLSLNQFDIHFFNLNCCVALMPIIGLRFTRINQHFCINANGGMSLGPTAFVLDDAIVMRNTFWGTGPKVGISMQWGSWCGFSLFGSFEAALLYGKFTVTQNETITFSDNVPATTFLNIHCNQFHMTRPNIGAILGVQWEWQRERCNVCISAGWEHQYFFAQNQLLRFSDDVNPGVNNAVHGDLALQGVTIALSFSY